MIQLSHKSIVYALLALTAFATYLLLKPSREIKNADPSGTNIICFGDSLTYGTGASGGKDYPSQLSALISKPVINAGVPGDTTSRAIKRLDRDVLSRNPRIVLVALGGNDLKNGVPLAKARDNLRTIIESIQNRGALVVLGGIDVPLWGRGYGKAYKDLANETGAVLVPNVLDGIFGNPGLMSDPIHPNNDGYAIMAEMFHDAIKPYL
jgi:lysophospholipase L1-like esterase